MALHPQQLTGPGLDTLLSSFYTPAQLGQMSYNDKVYAAQVLNLNPDTVVSPIEGNLLDSLNMWGYGHSFVAGVLTVAQASWVARAAGRLGMKLTNRGVGGDRAEDTVSRAIGNGAAPWNQNTVGLVVIENAINDLRFSGNTAAGITGYKNALRWLLTFFQGTILSQQSGSCTYTGTWTFPANADFVEGAVKATQTNGDHVDIAVNIGSGGEISLMTVGGPAGSIYASVVFTLDPAGANTTLVPVGSAGSPVSMNGQAAVDTGALNAKVYNHVMMRFTGLPQGNHVIRMTKVDATANWMYFNGVVLPRSNPPSIIVCKEAPLNNWTLNAPYNNGSAQALAAYNAAIDQVIAEFTATGYSNISSCDLTSAGWNPQTDINTLVDNVHPNDIGTNHLSAALVAATASLTARSGLLAGYP